MRATTEAEKLRTIAAKEGYAAYLKTDHWLKLRKRLCPRGARCMACGKAGTLNLHHVSYGWLGCERWRDLVRLCRKCHIKVHEALVLHYPDQPLGYQVQQTRIVWADLFGGTLAAAWMNADWARLFNGKPRTPRKSKPKPNDQKCQKCGGQCKAGGTVCKRCRRIEQTKLRQADRERREKVGRRPRPKPNIQTCHPCPRCKIRLTSLAAPLCPECMVVRTAINSRNGDGSRGRRACKVCGKNKTFKMFAENEKTCRRCRRRELKSPTMRHHVHRTNRLSRGFAPLPSG